MYCDAAVHMLKVLVMSKDGAQTIKITDYVKPQIPKMIVQFLIKFGGTIVELLLPWMLSHILDVFTYLTDADLRAIEIHEGLINRVKEVLNTICSMKVAKASVQYPVAQLRILVSWHRVFS